MCHQKEKNNEKEKRKMNSLQNPVIIQILFHALIHVADYP